MRYSPKLPPSNFNSRPSARGDASNTPTTIVYSPFQFTPLREGRRDWHADLRQYSCHFNSRPSARGDMMRHRLRLPPSYFNSRPSARGDLWAPAAAAANVIAFQFTPLREGRRDTGSAFDGGSVFQFTPLREGRLVHGHPQHGGRISIHAPPRGATPSDSSILCWILISIHAPPRGATES